MVVSVCYVQWNIAVFSTDHLWNHSETIGGFVLCCFAVCFTCAFPSTQLWNTRLSVMFHCSIVSDLDDVYLLLLWFVGLLCVVSI